jgi:hypothetical protein
MTLPTTTTGRAPSSRLSTAAIIAITFVAVLVLGGVGALIGKSAESDNKLPRRFGSPVTATNNLRAGTLSKLTATPRSVHAGAAATDSVILGDNIVTVPVPPDWEATVGDDTFTVFMSKPGFSAFLNIYNPDVKPDPTVVVSDVLDAWVRQSEGYSDVRPTQIRTDPDIESYAFVLYSGTLSTTSGSLSVVGELDAFVREDGEVLAVKREAAGYSFDEALDAFTAEASLQTIVQGAGDSFRNG